MRSAIRRQKSSRKRWTLVIPRVYLSQREQWVRNCIEQRQRNDGGKCIGVQRRSIDISLQEVELSRPDSRIGRRGDSNRFESSSFGTERDESFAGIRQPACQPEHTYPHIHAERARAKKWRNCAQKSAGTTPDLERALCGRIPGSLVPFQPAAQRPDERYVALQIWIERRARLGEMGQGMLALKQDLAEFVG